MTTQAWRDARHVLAIRLDGMAEVLMCTPAMRAIKESHPQRSLTLLTSASGAAVSDFIPEIDAVLEYAAPWMHPACPGGLPHDLRVIEALRAERFDAAVIFTACHQSPLPAAMLCRLAGIPLSLAHCREHPYHLISDRVPEAEPECMVRHEIQRQLDLVASVGWQTADGRMSFVVPRMAGARTLAALAARRIHPHAAYVVLHPGAADGARRSSPLHRPELWATLAEGLYARLQCPIVFSGSRSDRALVEAIADRCRASVTSLAGELDLGELGALVAGARIVVAGHCGAAHMAVALNTPGVNVTALADPGYAPCQGQPCRLCAPGGHAGQYQSGTGPVTPERVLAAVDQLLARTDRT